jgi:RimJ/RimL family protein N-acetyltransferase
LNCFYFCGNIIIGDSMKILFKPLEETDFEKLYEWLNQPHIMKWWENRPKTMEEVNEKYKKRIQEKEISTYIFYAGNTPIGMIQSYYVKDLDPFRLSGSKAVGIDLYIGDSDYLYKGYGTEVIRQYIDEYIKVNYDCEYVCIDPDENNFAAIKSYMKVGFKVVNIGVCPNCKTHNNAYMILKLTK